MKKLSCQPAIKKIKDAFGEKFFVSKESRNKFYFDGAFYSPDLVFFYNKKTNKIIAVLEVEQGTRKHVVGRIITANYCMRRMKEKPLMLGLALKK